MEEKKGGLKREHGWIPNLLDGVFGTIHNFVEGTVGSIHDAAHEFTRGLMHRAFLFLMTLFGIYFLCAGLAEMMSVVYQKPGIGGIAIGISVLLIVWVIQVFRKK